jgi:hypothetical protein
MGFRNRPAPRYTTAKHAYNLKGEIEKMISEEMKKEIEEYLKKRNRDRTVTTESLTTQTPEQIQEQAEAVAKYQVHHESNKRLEAEIDSHYTKQIVHPVYKCPSCLKDQVARPTGNYRFIGVYVSELTCKFCQKIHYSVNYSEKFSISRFGMKPDDFDLNLLEKRIEDIEKDLNPVSILTQVRKKILGDSLTT